MIYSMYSDTINGGIIQAGNCIGLAGVGPTMTGMANLAVASVAPPGGTTTTNYAQDSSGAYLRIPSGGTVVYAMLVWVGTYKNTAGDTMAASVYNGNITLKRPTGTTSSIASTVAYRQQLSISNGTTLLYANFSDITAIVKAAGSGLYTVGAVPTLLGGNDACSGWQIVAVYARQSDPLRNLNVWYGFENVTGTGGGATVVIPVTNFFTPTVSAVKARFIVGAAGGNSNIVGDHAQFGTNISVPGTMHTLFGPNNPANNFFCSQINGDTGALDTTGTFGTRNTVPPAVPTMGNRQMWDTTNIDISYALTNGQTDGVLALVSTGDSYQLVAMGLQIDMNQANIDPFAKSADKTTAKLGETITYSITFQNTGDVEAEGTIIIDDLPDTVAFVPGSVTLNGVSVADADPTVGVVVGSIPPNQPSASVLTFQAIVVSTEPGTVVTNTARVSYTFVPGTGLPPYGGEETSDEVDIPIEDSAVIAAVKSVDKTTALVGDVLTYTFNMTNSGNVNAENVTFTDALSAALQYMAGSLTLDGTPISGTPGAAALPLPDLTPGTHTLTFRATVTGVKPVNPIPNTATFRYDYLSFPGTRVPTVTYNTNTVQTFVPNADLSVVKTASAAGVQPGDVLTYTLTIANAGPSDAPNTIVTDAVSALLTNVQYSLNNGLSWSAWGGSYATGTLANGASRSILIRGTVVDSATGSIVNTATVASDLFDPDLTNNSSTTTTPVTEIADISIVKTASTEPVVAGTQLTYTLAIHNTGPSTAQSTVLTDAVVANFTNPQFSTDGGATWNTWTGTYSLGDLLKGANITVLLRGTVDVNASGTLANTASVASTTQDPDPTNNTSSTTTTITRPADISVVKTAGAAVAGNLLVYTLAIHNAGPLPAEDVVLTDSVVSTLSNVQFSTDNGVTWNAWNGTYALGRMALNATVTILIRGLIPASYTGTIVNTAQVATSSFDPDLSNNVSTVTSTVGTSADVSIKKVAGAPSVNPRDVLTYTLTVANAGPSDAVNVIVTDTVSAMLSSAQYSLDNGTSWSAWPGSYTVGTLALGASRSLLIRGTVVDSATGTITNTATASSDTPDPDPSNNTSTTTTPVSELADVSIVKTASPSPVTVAQPLTYTLTIKNAGPSAAQNVVVTDAVPSGILTPLFSTNGGVTWSAWLGTYSIATLPSGTTVTLLIRGTIADATTGSLINTATALSDTPDPDPSNNTSTVTTPVLESADVSIVKAAAPNPVVAGTLLLYTLAIKNAGPSAAKNTVLTDVVPDTLTNPQFSLDNGATWNAWTGSYTLGSLDEGATRTVQIRGTVSANATANLANTAYVTSDTPDPDLSNNTSNTSTTVTRPADLSIVKTAGSAVAGDLLQYTLTIRNAGPLPADNTVLTDAVPSTLTNAQYSTDGGTTWSNWSGSYALGTVPVSATVTVLVRGQIGAAFAGTITNTASVLADNPDPDPSNNTSTATSTVGASADLSMVKTANATGVNPRDVLTYTLTVSNAGPSDAQNVTISDTVSSTLSGVQYSLNNGGTWSAWTGAYTVGTLAAGASRSLLIRGTVVDSATGSIINTAKVSSDTPDPDPDNNTSTTDTPVTELADVSIVKTAFPEPAVAGTQLTFTLAIKNAGPSTAKNVVLTDAVPANVTNAQFSTDSGATWNAWTGSYALGALASGQNVTVLIRGTISVNASGTLENQASVASDTRDPDPSNNSSTSNTTVTRPADLSVVKTAGAAVAGNLLQYTLAVHNAGPLPADNTVLTDAVPSTLTSAQYSTDNGVTWSTWSGSYTLGTVQPNATVTVLIRGQIGSSFTGTIANTASVDSDNPDPDPSNNSSTTNTPVETSADISMKKTAGGASVNPREVLTYTLTVSNAGPSDARNVVMSDTVSTLLSGVQYSTNNGVTWSAWPGRYTVGTLATGASLSILIRGTVVDSAAGSIVNTAKASSDTPDPDPDNNTSTTDTPITELADVSIVKAATPVPATAGSLLTYTLTATNAGPSSAQNVIVSDTLPGRLTNPEYSVDAGITWNAWTGSYVIGTMTSGATKTIVIRGTVDMTTTGSISNTATVASDTPDPDPSNNTSTSTIDVLNFARLNVTKAVDRAYADIGDTISYTMDIVNVGNVNANNVSFVDVIPSEVAYVANSLVLDGIPISGTPGSRIALPSLAPGNHILAFSVTVVAIPAVNPIPNSATFTYDYIPLPGGTPVAPIQTTTNVVTTLVNNADVVTVKSVDKENATCGDVVNYTVVLNNTGNVIAQNVSLTDSIPAGSELVAGSVTINGIPQPDATPESLVIGSIPAHGQVIVGFRVNVICT